MADANDPALFGGDSADEFHVLLQRYLDSKLSDDELASLDQRLREDPAVRAEFARGLMRQAFLRELVAQERSASSLAEMLDEEETAKPSETEAPQRAPIIPPLSDDDGPLPTAPGPSWPAAPRSAPLGPLPGSPLSSDDGASASGGFSFPEIHNWRFTAFALLMLFAVGLVYWNSGGEHRFANKLQPVAPVVAAEPVSQQGCTWLVDGKPANPRQFMTGATVQLKQGKAELRLENDVRVTMEGAVKFRLAAPDRLILVDGSATAHVPPAAVGFMVDAPAIRVTDLGTEFGVRSLGDGQAVLHVFQGAVEVELADGSGKKRVVRTGQSIGARMELEHGRWNYLFDAAIKINPGDFSRAAPADRGKPPKSM